MLLYNFTLKDALDLTAKNYGISNFRKTAMFSIYLQVDDIWFLEDAIEYITTNSTFPKSQHLVVFIISRY